MNENKDSNKITLTKRAALRHGIELTKSEANKHAEKIAENADAQEEQSFWDAAKEYFLNT